MTAAPHADKRRTNLRQQTLISPRKVDWLRRPSQPGRHVKRIPPLAASGEREAPKRGTEGFVLAAAATAVHLLTETDRRRQREREIERRDIDDDATDMS